MGTNDIIKELQEFEYLKEDNCRQTIRDFIIKHILEWEKDYKIKIIKGKNKKNDNPISPYYFALNKKNDRDIKVYEELLRIAFALIIMKKGVLDFINPLLQTEHPLSIMTNILDSIKNKNREYRIDIKHNDVFESNLLVTQIKQREVDKKWYLYCRNDKNESIKIPFDKIQSVRKAT